ncbi:amino acid ABC transporter permease [Roseibium porphyridii]|uniref:Amino acid ABC transporter permease n=1 Tax=Roseibium porphyridii TaxID=2866279 RepID=A0ABY8F3R9_9HYPH|nr:amino acid ABC transporter permease [Roseibium sp. KMA01]WFE89856.1 amino acid ABC transporter permease [Roseibium sp. KMA01]
MSGDLATMDQEQHSPVRPGRTWFSKFRRNYFGTPISSAISILLIALVVATGPAVLRWLVLDATFTGTAAACRENGGPCWAFIGAKLNLILFGAYPDEQLWRPVLFLSTVAAIGVYGYMFPRRQTKVLLAWLLSLLLGMALMRGGFLGLAPVDNARWGGLPVTIIVTIAGLAGAFPLGVLLMLGSASKNIAIQIPCKAYIDVVRGIPAITLVFMTFAIIPLLTPQEFIADKLLRASTGLMLLTAAYFAEALRGALEALPKGQDEAGKSLGFRYWKRQRLIILPQVIGNSLQPIANISIAFVKNTSLLIIIGLFDLLGAARSSLFDGDWQGFYRELYLFVGAIYLVICLFMDAYVTSMERERKERISR